MKKKSHSKSAFITPRTLIGFALCFMGVGLAVFALTPSADPLPRFMPVPGGNPESEAADLGRLDQYWNDRLTYPTGIFDPAWVRQAAAQHMRMPSGIPAGGFAKLKQGGPLALTTAGFTALGPQPERMTGCSGCSHYTRTEGRVNA